MLMKRRVVLLAVILTVLSMVSCSFGGGEKPADKENLIYDSIVYLVYDPDLVSGELVSRISEGLFYHEVDVRSVTDSEPDRGNEIVIGRSERSVSKDAYRYLERIEKNGKDDLRYCIYSNGSSVAIAYDEDEYGCAVEAAIDRFAENYVSSELVLEKGVAASSAFDRNEYLGERDEIDFDKRLEALAEKIGGENGRAIADAFRTLYSIYDGEALIKWVCNLYDPCICVCTAYAGETECKGTVYCGSGGFYYSNSARDNYGFLPDAESTMQALNFLGDCGISPKLGSYKSIVPDWMAEHICNYLYNLQDPDGFFYHPQWGKTIGNSRRGRDASWCRTILKEYGVSLRYATMGEVEEIDPVSSAALQGRLGNSAVQSVSRVIAAESATLIPDHLKTVEAFKAYLVRLDLRSNSYGGGNTLSAQCGQIIARGTEFVNVLEEHLNSCQYDNGIWHPMTNYYGINGLMKISGVYNMIGKAIPNAEKACRAAFAAVSSDEEVGDIVDIWNAWDAAKRVIGNISSYSAGGAQTAKMLRAAIMADAADALIETRDKLAVFLKSDGSFSYEPHESAWTSQGSVVAVKGTNEGDMNATAMATTYMINTLFECLGLEGNKIPFMGTRERIIFNETINGLSPVIKDGDVLTVGEPYDFDYDDVGSTPTAITTKGTGTSMVIADDRGDGGVFSFNSVSGSGSYLTVRNLGVAGMSQGMVFESELCILTESFSSGSLRIDLAGESDTDIAYRIIFKKSENGIELWDSAAGVITNNQSNYLGITVDSGEWFRLRVEYYPGDEYTTRSKIYFNGKLVSVSDNFFDESGKKLTGEGTPKSDPLLTRFYVLKDSEMTILVDNIASYYVTQGYSREELCDEYRDDPYSFDVDRISSEAVIYGFDDGISERLEISESGRAEVVGADKALLLTGGASATLPSVKRTAMANCSTVSFDLTIDNVGKGKLLRINFVDRNPVYSGITAYTVEAAQGSDGGYLLTMKEDHVEKVISGVELTPGVTVNLRLDYYENEGVVIIYVDGVMAGMIGTLSVAAKRQVFGKLRLETYGTADVRVDNISAERRYMDYAKETAPKYEGLVYGFDDGIADATISGSASVVTRGDDAVLKISGSGSAAIFPLRLRDDTVRGSAVSFDISFSGYDKNGVVQTVSVVDKDGEGIISFVLMLKGGSVTLYEKTSLGTHTAPLAEFAADRETEIALELYESYGTCKIFVNGEYVIESALLYDTDAQSRTPAWIKLTSGDSGAAAYVDDLEAYRANLIYIPSETVNREDGSAEIGFDYSGGSNIPSVITSSIYSGAPAPIVVEAIKDGVADKVLKFESYVAPNAGMDALKLNPTVEVKNAVSYAFEANIFLKDHVSSLPVQFNLWGARERALEINFEISDGVIYLYNTGLKSQRVAAARVGEWFNFKVEYYAVEDDGQLLIRGKVFINGTLLYVTDDYEGAAPTSVITYASFNALKGSAVTMYLDDLLLVQSTKAYDGSNVTHTLH